MGARNNLLLQSEALNTSPWYQDADTVSITVTPNAAAGPFGGAATAGQFLLPAGNSTDTSYEQDPTLTNGVVYCFSIYAKLVSGNGEIALQFFNGVAVTNTATPFTATSTWQRFSISFTHTTGGSFASGVLFGKAPLLGGGQTIAGTVLFWGAQVNPGTRPDDYLLTTTATKTGVYAEASSIGAMAEGTGAVTPNLPANYTDGTIDLNAWFYLYCETANEAVATPSGWTVPTGAGAQGTGTAAGTAATRLTVFRAPSGTAMPSIADPGDHLSVTCVFVSGAAQGVPEHICNGDVLASASTAVTFKDITTSIANCYVMVGVANATDTATAQGSGYTAGWTEILNNNSAQGNGGGVSVASKLIASPAALGSVTATLATSSVQGRISIAIAPKADTPFRRDLTYYLEL